MRNHNLAFTTWLPRLLAIASLAYLMLFSFDAFSTGAPVGEMILGFLLHNIPTILLGAVVALAWEHEWAGGTVFGLAGVAYIADLAFGRGFQTYMLTWVLAISGPALLVSAAYWFAWRRRVASRSAATE